MRITNKNGPNFLNIILHRGGYPKYLLRLAQKWMQAFHQYCRQQAKSSSLGCWASRWLQTRVQGQSRWYFMVCVIKIACHRPLCFREWEWYGLKQPKYWNSLCIPELQSVARRRNVFRKRVLLRSIQNNLYHTLTTSVQKRGLRGVDLLLDQHAFQIWLLAIPIFGVL